MTPDSAIRALRERYERRADAQQQGATDNMELRLVIDDLRELESALSAQGEAVAHTHYAYLIERDTSPPTWWAGDDEWTEVALHAVWFPTRYAAEGTKVAVGIYDRHMGKDKANRGCALSTKKHGFDFAHAPSGWVSAEAAEAARRWLSEDWEIYDDTMVDTMANELVRLSLPPSEVKP